VFLKDKIISISHKIRKYVYLIAGVLKNKRISISKKLTLIYSSILLSILIIFAVLTFLSIRNFIIKDSESILSSNVDIISNFISNSQNINKSSLNNINLSQGIYYSVCDENGNIICSNMDSIQSDKKHPDGKQEKHKEKDFQHNNGIISTNKTVSIKGKKYNILVTKDFEDIGTNTEAITAIFIIISILGTIVCFISGYFLTKKLLKPIKDITKTAKEITSKSLNKRIVTNGVQDEIKDLADTCNSMIERLEVDFEKQRRFVSDASHELRTPLSVIYGHVNMLNRWGKNDPTQLEKSLKTLKNETENMHKLIESLLYLAKGDNNVLVIKKEEFELYNLIKEVVDETLLNHSQIEISYNCEQELEIYADYNALKQVLRILVDNSIKFSKDFGQIIINAEVNDKEILINVIDNGSGISEESIPHIFDRFYRADESRNKTTGGTGLGLSIAKQIVDYHEGRILVESKLEQGTKISIFIPK
jgi:signal transduction histidine kinase